MTTSGERKKYLRELTIERYNGRTKIIHYSRFPNQVLNTGMILVAKGKENRKFTIIVQFRYNR